LEITMPRQRRLFVPGIPVHVIQRGNNRQPCFFSDRDKIIYLDKLREYTSRFGVACHAFVLMDNHVHLLATPASDESVSLALQALGRWYVRYFNNTYQRTGTLWEGRFKACIVQSDRYFLAVSRYIELNPVRAAITNHPAGYTWSSYAHNALGKKMQLLTPHSAYLAVGRDEQERLQRYGELFHRVMHPSELEQIRKTVQKSQILGDADFRWQIEAQTGRKLTPLPRGGNRQARSKGSE
jgi:putative transposase